MKQKSVLQQVSVFFVILLMLSTPVAASSQLFVSSAGGTLVTDNSDSSPEEVQTRSQDARTDRIVNEAVGEVVVASDPSGAEVHIDGTFVGTTPFDATLPAGRYVTIVVNKEGYQEYTVTDYVNTNTPIRVHATLEESDKVYFGSARIPKENLVQSDLVATQKGSGLFNPTKIIRDNNNDLYMFYTPYLQYKERDEANNQIHHYALTGVAVAFSSNNGKTWQDLGKQERFFLPEPWGSSRIGGFTCRDETDDDGETYELCEQSWPVITTSTSDEAKSQYEGYSLAEEGIYVYYSIERLRFRSVKTVNRGVEGDDGPTTTYDNSVPVQTYEFHRMLFTADGKQEDIVLSQDYHNQMHLEAVVGSKQIFSKRRTEFHRDTTGTSRSLVSLEKLQFFISEDHGETLIPLEPAYEWEPESGVSYGVPGVATIPDRYTQNAEGDIYGYLDNKLYLLEKEQFIEIIDLGDEGIPQPGYKVVHRFDEEGNLHVVKQEEIPWTAEDSPQSVSNKIYYYFVPRHKLTGENPPEERNSLERLPSVVDDFGTYKVEVNKYQYDLSSDVKREVIVPNVYVLGLYVTAGTPVILIQSTEGIEKITPTGNSWERIKISGLSKKLLSAEGFTNAIGKTTVYLGAEVTWDAPIKLIDYSTEGATKLRHYYPELNNDEAIEFFTRDPDSGVVKSYIQNPDSEFAKEVRFVEYDYKFYSLKLPPDSDAISLPASQVVPGGVFYVPLGDEQVQGISGQLTEYVDGQWLETIDGQDYMVVRVDLRLQDEKAYMGQVRARPITGLVTFDSYSIVLKLDVQNRELRYFDIEGPLSSAYTGFEAAPTVDGGWVVTNNLALPNVMCGVEIPPNSYREFTPQETEQYNLNSCLKQYDARQFDAHRSKCDSWGEIKQQLTDEIHYSFQMSAPLLMYTGGAYDAKINQEIIMGEDQTFYRLVRLETDRPEATQECSSTADDGYVALVSFSGPLYQNEGYNPAIQRVDSFESPTKQEFLETFFGGHSVTFPLDPPSITNWRKMMLDQEATFLTYALLRSTIDPRLVELITLRLREYNTILTDQLTVVKALNHCMEEGNSAESFFNFFVTQEVDSVAPFGSAVPLASCLNDFKAHPDRHWPTFLSKFASSVQSLTPSKIRQATFENPLLSYLYLSSSLHDVNYEDYLVEQYNYLRTSPDTWQYDEDVLTMMALDHLARALNYLRATATQEEQLAYFALSLNPIDRENLAVVNNCLADFDSFSDVLHKASKKVNPELYTSRSSTGLPCIDQISDQPTRLSFYKSLVVGLWSPLFDSIIKQQNNDFSAIKDFLNSYYDQLIKVESIEERFDIKPSTQEVLDGRWRMRGDLLSNYDIAADTVEKMVLLQHEAKQLSAEQSERLSTEELKAIYVGARETAYGIVGCGFALAQSLGTREGISMLFWGGVIMIGGAIGGGVAATTAGVATTVLAGFGMFQSGKHFLTLTERWEQVTLQEKVDAGCQLAAATAMTVVAYPATKVGILKSKKVYNKFKRNMVEKHSLKRTHPPFSSEGVKAVVSKGGTSHIQQSSTPKTLTPTEVLLQDIPAGTEIHAKLASLAKRLDYDTVQPSQGANRAFTELVAEIKSELSAARQLDVVPKTKPDNVLLRRLHTRKNKLLDEIAKDYGKTSTYYLEAKGFSNALISEISGSRLVLGSVIDCSACSLTGGKFLNSEKAALNPESAKSSIALHEEVGLAPLEAQVRGYKNHQLEALLNDEVFANAVQNEISGIVNIQETKALSSHAANALTSKKGGLSGLLGANKYSPELVALGEHLQNLLNGRGVNQFTTFWDKLTNTNLPRDLGVVLRSDFGLEPSTISAIKARITKVSKDGTTFELKIKTPEGVKTVELVKSANSGAMELAAEIGRSEAGKKVYRQNIQNHIDRTTQSAPEYLSIQEAVGEIGFADALNLPGVSNSKLAGLLGRLDAQFIRDFQATSRSLEYSPNIARFDPATNPTILADPQMGLGTFGKTVKLVTSETGAVKHLKIENFHKHIDSTGRAGTGAQRMRPVDFAHQTVHEALTQQMITNGRSSSAIYGVYRSYYQGLASEIMASSSNGKTLARQFLRALDGLVSQSNSFSRYNLDVARVREIISEVRSDIASGVIEWN